MMTPARERTRNHSEKVAERGGYLSKRFHDNRTFILCSKDPQGLCPLSMNSEQRGFVLGAVTFESIIWMLLAPFSPLLRGYELRRHFCSEACVEEQGDHDSPLSVFVLLESDFLDQKIDLSDSPGSSKSSSSFSDNIVNQMRNKLRTRAARNSSMPNSVESNNSSVDASVVDASAVANLNDFLDHIPDVDTHPKSARRRTGRKKKKQSKKHKRGKVSPSIETQSEMVHDSETIQSISNECSINADMSQNDSQCESSDNILFDKGDVSLLGSCADNCTEDGGKSYEKNDERSLCEKGNEGLTPSLGGTRFCSADDLGCKDDEVASTCCSSNLKNVVDTDHITETSECSGQTTSSDGFQPVVNRRRRRGKKASQSERGAGKFVSEQNLHKSHTVQKINAEKCRGLKPKSDSSQEENNNLEKTSSPVLQRCVPAECTLDLEGTYSLAASGANGSVLHSPNSDIKEESPSSSFQQSTGLSVCHHPNTGSGLPALPDQKFSGVNTDLGRIVQAVQDSSKLRTSLDGVHLLAGNAVAVFESFLHSASPLLDQIWCKSRSPAQLIGNASYVHQIPNIPLPCLWNWYERPGSYGIEVKVDDYYNSKRPHSISLGFRAFFVPFISAIQLFGWARSSECLNNCYPSEFSGHFAPDHIYSQPLRSTHLDKGELLFEYFETDQPHRRRPLFEKIKELLREDTASDSKIYGDPLKLECLNLHDLHPASWYSVAWYPIYRIPGGELRAAFLTYHSLGHFHRTTSKRPGDVASIVSPVVGLQSYNAQGECWFKPTARTSQMIQAGQIWSPDPTGALKERLNTLEQTASVMATASVCKNNRSSKNRHPDYEFFKSRRSWSF